MNVLEKILEEIKERIEKLNMADNMCRENAERNKNFESVKYFQSLMFATERAESIIEDIIRSHMDEAKNDGWIPCSERLPNEIEFQEAYCRNQYAAEILVTIKGATRPTTLYFKNNSWFDEERNYYEVVAWQPLPEPYKGGKENE